MSALTKLLVASFAFCALTSHAAPTLTFAAGLRVGSSEFVEFTARVEGLSGYGLASVHVDLRYDEASIDLVQAQAGDFFTLNEALGSAWTDTVAITLSEGDDLASSVTDAFTGPDSLGFDLLETTGVASTLDGELLRLLFRWDGIGPGRFSTNDVLLIDALGNAYSLAGQVIDIGGPGGSVNEPPTLALVALAGLALVRPWRRAV